ncbi:MAG: aldehyde dehydrogenase family protein [Planctomycetota bacterium]
MSFKIEKEWLISLNPATDQEVGRLPISSAEEVSRSVKQARSALIEWSKKSFEERATLLEKGLKKLKEEASIWGRIITDEMGKPLREGIGEANYAAENTLEEVIPLARDAITPQIFEEETLITTLHYVPRGVVAAITPWNFPASLSLDAIVPALLMGNTVVYKPSEYVPFVGKKLVETLNAFLPANVLTILYGDGKVGELLIRDDISLVAFVGSQSIGRHIMEVQAGKLNPVILELGGKDPMIVLADADLDQAAKFAVQNSLRNCGQVCVSVERIYVEEKIAAPFEKQVRELMKDFRMGNPLEDGVRMGPMVSESQRKKVLDKLEDARKKGAIVEGGTVPKMQGCFLNPALVTKVTDDMKLMQEEIFGPVIVLQPVKDSEEAIRKSNQLSYGLGATVWSKNEDRANQIAIRLEAGMIGINRGLGGASGTPFVGAKQSGIGFFGGIDGMRQFAQIRKITKNKKPS